MSYASIEVTDFIGALPRAIIGGLTSSPPTTSLSSSSPASAYGCAFMSARPSLAGRWQTVPSRHAGFALVLGDVKSIDTNPASGVTPQVATPPVGVWPGAPAETWYLMTIFASRWRTCVPEGRRDECLRLGQAAWLLRSGRRYASLPGAFPDNPRGFPACLDCIGVAQTSQPNSQRN